VVVLALAPRPRDVADRVCQEELNLHKQILVFQSSFSTSISISTAWAPTESANNHEHREHELIVLQQPQNIEKSRQSQLFSALYCKLPNLNSPTTAERSTGPAVIVQHRAFNPSAPGCHVASATRTLLAELEPSVSSNLVVLSLVLCSLPVILAFVLQDLPLKPQSGRRFLAVSGPSMEAGCDIYTFPGPSVYIAGSYKIRLTLCDTVNK